MSDPDQTKIMEKVKQFPKLPGVYLMKNGKGEVIYVGKAADLKARVRSYFTGADERCQVRFLIKRVDDIEVMVTDTEKEALILEDILIKKHRPRYNINLKDDKTYLSLKVDMKQTFPRVEVVRKREKDGARYFGPYSSAQAMRETLGLLQRLFQIRTCNDSYFNNRERPCLSYQIKRCLGPCCGFVDGEQYRESMGEVLLFLDGKSGELLNRFKARMKEVSDAMEFEEAARLRDCIASMEKTVERQKVYASGGAERDVLGIFREENSIAIYILFVRGGKLSGGSPFAFREQGLPGGEVVSSFIRRYYGEGRYVPGELLIPVGIDDVQLLEEWLGELRGRRVNIVQPKRGDKLKLVELAATNARNSLATHKVEEVENSRLLKDIREMFQLVNLPARMECFDISNIQGSLSVGSMVVFIDGKAERSLYRRFRIKTVDGADDFASMYEVLRRRLKRGVAEEVLPDLLVIDGGKGQLAMAERALADEGLGESIDVVALAKEKVFKGREGNEKREERVYMRGRKNPVRLKRSRDVMCLFQRIRDEAHRFAITYHKKLRTKDMLSSPLDSIPGIGPAKKKALLKNFGSLKGVREASVEELEGVRGITGELAHLIRATLSNLLPGEGN